MADRYLDTMLTQDVLAAEQRAYGGSYAIDPGSIDPAVRAGRDALGAGEIEFIGQRTSFYLATVNSDGWPYIQHRGGPRGFLKVLDEHTLGFADLRGNRQLITTGNVSGNDRVAMFLMDYHARRRLKVMGHARVLDVEDHEEIAERLSPATELRSRVERLFVIDVVSYDWNCPSYITAP